MRRKLNTSTSSIVENLHRDVVELHGAFSRLDEAIETVVCQLEDLEYDHDLALRSGVKLGKDGSAKVRKVRSRIGSHMEDIRGPWKKWKLDYDSIKSAKAMLDVLSRTIEDRPIEMSNV